MFVARLEKEKKWGKTALESCYERGLNVIFKEKESALDSGTKGGACERYQ